MRPPPATAPRRWRPPPLNDPSYLLLVVDRIGVFLAPADPDPPALLLERVRGGGLEVLADDLQLPARVELDQVAGDHARVGDVADLAVLHVQVLALRVQAH